ncbi:MAG: flavodoxin [Eubacterium sp.]|nr:flavodoxin [Eubacterium sp.]
MKKYLSILMVVAMLFSFAACSNNAKSTEPETTANTTEMQKTENTEASASVSGKTLVVYFGVPEDVDTNGADAVAGASVVVKDGEKVGNLQYVADIIQKNTGADVFRIEPKIPYNTNHEELVDLAKEEQNSNARPQIKNSIENFEQYDTVFVGYPNWWGDMPMILYTFFDTYDFSGKTIIPFNAHGGSGFSNTINTIKDLEPNANVNDDGYTVSRNNVNESESEIIAWLDDLGYNK